MFGWGFKCRKCHLPLSIIYARHYAKAYSKWRPYTRYGIPDRGDTVIKARCPKHGTFVARFNNQVKELWMDQLAKAMFQCTKCDEIGTTLIKQDVNGWTFFQINCPVHGLTLQKKVVTQFFNLAKELYEKGISYKDWILHHSDK